MSGVLLIRLYRTAFEKIFFYLFIIELEQRTNNKLFQINDLVFTEEQQIEHLNRAQHSKRCVDVITVMRAVF